MINLYARLQDEPALGWKFAVHLLGFDPRSTEAKRASQRVRTAPLVQSLLSERDGEGRIPYHPYKKWNGAHWVLSILADLGYPAGDESLRPLVEQSLAWLFSQAHARHIRLIDGRTRRCASQEGNAVWYSLRLGLTDDRISLLVERLMSWQWPDGGWNCDKHPEAIHSSYHESLYPLRALALYAEVSGDGRAKRAAERAAEIFLKRQLYLRQSDGKIMDRHFLLLNYPPYWHYDILCGLKVLVEAGFIGDPRTTTALDLLESKRLPDGGFPAEETYSRTTRPSLSGYSLVNWNGVSKKNLNVYVTIDALSVLKMAGRLRNENLLPPTTS